MATGPKRRRSPSGGAVVATLSAALCLAAALSPLAPAAAASGPPLVGAQWSSAVGSDAARLSAQLDPNGLNTTYHFEYTTGNDFTNCGTPSNPACHKAPASDATLLASSGTHAVTVSLSGLSPTNTYRYRIVAANSDPAGPSTGATKTFTTKGPGPLLLDSRGWEMVSPIDKSGGQVDLPGAISGGGVLQAASNGDSATYGSTASFAGGLGGPQGNQYLATRSASGWATQNITAPIAYQSKDGGVPYQLFSGDLTHGLLQNGDHCASGAGHCTVGNAPLAGTDAPPGYQDYYSLDIPSGAFTAMLGADEAANLDLSPAYFDLRFAGASPDLQQVVISSCAALVPGASEVPSGSGCDPGEQNLYEWSQGAGLSLINGGAPGAALAAQSGAVSTTGDRIYFTQNGDLYLHVAAGNAQVDADAGGGGSFQAASADGTVAFFTRSGHLYRYDDGTGHATDLTPSGGVVGVLGVSATADTAYFQDGGGLQRWHSGTTTQVVADAGAAPAADPGDYPPPTGTARVSADGTKLLFLSSAQLSGYDNTDLSSSVPCGQVGGVCDSEVYLYDSAGAGTLTCVSCNPTGERPIGPSTIPGAIANGSAPFSTQAYKPRVLSTDGRRVFFDSLDSLALTDTNQNHSSGAGIKDVYEWEANGEDSCASSGGCTSLISSGRSATGATFIDASANGSDAFFTTDVSLISTDPGAQDLYDARINGGFLIPSPPLACEGDACQVLTSPPGDPTLTTLLTGHGNPAIHYTRYGRKRHAKRCKRGFIKRHGRCVKKKKKSKHRKRHHKRGHR